MTEPATEEIERALCVVGVLVAREAQLDRAVAIPIDDVCKFEHPAAHRCGAPLTDVIIVSDELGAEAAAFCRHHAELVVRAIGIIRARKIQGVQA